MANFPYAHQKLLVLNGTVNATGDSSTLTAGEFGIYNKNTNVVVTPANAGANPYVYLAQGSYYTKDSVGNTPLVGLKESLKSPGINAKYVTRFYKIGAKAAANNIIKVGGASDLQFQSDFTYRLRVEAKGSPALRTLNRHLYKNVPFFTGCATSQCLTGCDKEYVDAGTVYKGWADYINADPLLSLFVIATPYREIATFSGVWAAGASNVIASDISQLVVGQTLIGPGLFGTITGFVGNIVNLDTPNTKSGLAVPVSVGAVIDNTYVPAPNSTTVPTSVAYLLLTAAYIDTVFSDCSFNPIDFYQKEPIILYASLVDETGNPCHTGPHINSNTNENTEQVREPVQPEGLGETVLRDYIKAREYDGIHFNRWPRKREVEIDPAFQVVTRSKSYNRYYFQFNVPKFSNSTNTFNNDQFLYGFAFESTIDTTAFEALMTAWLAANNPLVTLEVIN
ncbi:MAG TPA: hypothetical protein VGM30_10590 [Puia sp.]|jgi:hypothetical protein